MTKPEDTNYISLEISIGNRHLMFQTKLGDEGIILDVFDLTAPNSVENPKVLATTYRFYNEIKTHRITSNPCLGCSFFESELRDIPCKCCTERTVHGSLCYKTNFYTTEYLIEVGCKDCLHPHAAILIHLCDKMDDPNHDTCSDRCNPTEENWHTELKPHPQHDPFLRCAKCGTYNHGEFELP